MQKNKREDAEKALIWFRGKKYDPTVELNEMQIAIKEQKEVTQSMTAAMLRKSTVKGLCITFGLFICQQLCGINVVIFYTTDIFEVSDKTIFSFVKSNENIA